ncbi:MAG: hypothetical protein WC370_06125 [Dehalococcoidales bacterium]
MDVKYYRDASEFIKHAGEFLAVDEARYGLVLGIAKAVVVNPYQYAGQAPWFCSIGKENDIYAVAMRTPPYNLIVARFSGDPQVIAEKLMLAVAAQFTTIPGVVGDKELGDAFADLWCEKHGVTIKDKTAQRVYRLDKVNNVPVSPGRFRPATMAEKNLVARWHHAFNIDCFGPDKNVPETDVTPVIERGWVFFWEDGKPVSMALKTRPTDEGMTVSGVYTPPELRGKGYATSCVAELSRNILQSGK